MDPGRIVTGAPSNTLANSHTYNEENTMKTVNVAFRISPDPDYFDNPGQEVIALFPDLYHNERMYGKSQITAYLHVGQHCAARADLIDDLEPATPEEYAELLAELRGMYETAMAPGDAVYKLAVID